MKKFWYRPTKEYRFFGPGRGPRGWIFSLWWVVIAFHPLNRSRRIP